MSLGQTLFASRLPWPADWPAIFGRAAPLLVEAGFGSGQFLLELAEQRPEANILGLEISLPSLRKVERKLARAGFRHVRLLQATAQTVLWALCPPGSVNRLTINFPDPWPKAAHHHRRLVSDRFLHLAATRLPAGSHLDIATDHDDYAAWIVERLARTPYFDSRLATPFTTQEEARLGTKYEAKALAEGRLCRYFLWRRNEMAAPNVFPIPQELPMPHAVVTLPLTLDQIQAGFAAGSLLPRRWTAGPTSVRLNDLYRAVTHDALLCDAYVNEEPLDQRLLLVITQRRPGEFLLHLHEVGFPRPTAGVHFAIHCLATWLTELHPEARLVHHNLQVTAQAI